MSKRTVDLDAIARQVEQTIARNRAIFGNLRMELDGTDGGGEGGDDGQGGDGGAGGEGGATETGYPANTPVAEMTLEQQVAYHKATSRKHEARAKAREDYDTVKAELATLKQQHETEQEKAVREAKEAGAAEARQGSATDTAKALLRLAIRARKNDITDDDLAEIVAVTNLSAFVAGDGVDEAKILAHASRSVGTTDGKGPDMGQGNRGNQSQESGVAAGRSMFAASRGGKTP